MFYYEQFFSTALNGIDRSNIMPVTIQIAQVILLISFLVAVYESFIRGGDVRMLGIAAVKYVGLGSIARVYAINVMVFHYWGVIYAILGGLIAAVNLGSVQQVLTSGSFIGGFVGLEQSMLLGVASIFYSISISVIPFLAARII